MVLESEIEYIKSLNIKGVGQIRAEKIAGYFGNLMSGDVDWVCDQLQGTPELVRNALKDHFSNQKYLREKLENIASGNELEDIVEQSGTPTEPDHSNDFVEDILLPTKPIKITILTPPKPTVKKPTIEIMLVGVDNAKKKVKNWKRFGVHVVDHIHADIDYAVVPDHDFNDKTKKRFRKRHNVNAIKESEFIELLRGR